MDAEIKERQIIVAAEPDTAAEQSPEPAGDFLGDFVTESGTYKKLKELGSGGMGVVYLIDQDGMKNPLALKTLHPNLADDPVVAKRFVQEAKTVAELNHPNLVAIYAHGLSQESRPYLLMDYIQGQSLSQIIADGGPLGLERFFNIILQVAEGLSYAHEKGVIHRDLKPTNIMVQTNQAGVDSVKIVDFGIAKLMPQLKSMEQRLTQTGDILGSPVYMSPEQCLGSRVDERSDIYALGCVMYECLTGSPPFLAKNVVQTILQHLKATPKPITSETIPQELKSIIYRCLSKDPAKRYQRIEDLVTELKVIDPSLSAGQQSDLRNSIRKRRWTRLIKQKGLPIAFGLTLGLSLALAAGNFYDKIQTENLYSACLKKIEMNKFNHLPKDQFALYTQAIGTAKKLGKSEKEILGLELAKAKLSIYENTSSDSKTNELQQQELTGLAKRLSKYPELSKERRAVLGTIGSNLAFSSYRQNDVKKTPAQLSAWQESQNSQDLATQLAASNKPKAAVEQAKKALFIQQRFDLGSDYRIKNQLSDYYLALADEQQGLEALVAAQNSLLLENKLEGQALIDKKIRELASQNNPSTIPSLSDVRQAYIEGDTAKAIVSQKLFAAKSDRSSEMDSFAKWLTTVHQRSGPSLPITVSSPNLTARREILLEQIAIDRSLGKPDQNRAYLFNLNLHEDLRNLAAVNFRLGRLEEAEKNIDELLSGTPWSKIGPIHKESRGDMVRLSRVLWLKLNLLKEQGKWKEADDIVVSLIPQAHSKPFYFEPFFGTSPAPESRSDLVHAYANLCDIHGRHSQAVIIRRLLTEASKYDRQHLAYPNNFLDPKTENPKFP